jgi:D-tagatose-1,6-bisphosphate aldolase subunit GatZ/KbaZ
MNYFDELIADQKIGKAVGITSICSAHPVVLKTTMQNAKKDGSVILIESTCNQVNQFGGYTGMSPLNFVTNLHEMAHQIGLPLEQLIIGGDHLGPNVWKKEPQESAMEKARILVRDYVMAGYQKIHIDTSMACKDDPKDKPLEPSIIAERTADLISICETVNQNSYDSARSIRYVIGTEVPPPGGMYSNEEITHPTKPELVREMIELTQKALAKRGLSKIWEKIIAVVVQPGVEFGSQVIFEYNPAKALELKKFIEDIHGMVFEAHSTDYQTGSTLQALVNDHFAILKVGPALTFAYREAVYALAMIERELHFSNVILNPSRIIETIESEMRANPIYWKDYYKGSTKMIEFERHYSFSDRIRYYWVNKKIQDSLAQLLNNLKSIKIPLSLISQYLPDLLLNIQKYDTNMSPDYMIQFKISQVQKKYYLACNTCS